MSVTLPEITAALAAQLATVPGVAAAYGLPPTQLGTTLPALVIFSDPQNASVIEMGMLETWHHRLLCRLYVNPAQNVQTDVGRALPFPELMVAALRARNRLGLGPEFHGVDVLTYQIGVAPYNATDYIIAELSVEARAKFGTEIIAQ